MTTLGLTILVAAGAISFALAALIALVPMNLFVRVSLVSLGFTGWLVLPFVAPGHDIDIRSRPTGSESLYGQWELGFSASRQVCSRDLHCGGGVITSSYTRNAQAATQRWQVNLPGDMRE
jgi:hypothetical protein